LESSQHRPVIFDYESVPRFVTDMIAWRRQGQAKFSIRAEAKKNPGCSPALISQIAKGQRRLTRDRVEAVGSLLQLSWQEIKFLDQWIALKRKVAPQVIAAESNTKASQINLVDGEGIPKPENNLVGYWLNPYVREACRLSSFRMDPIVIHKLLGGIATLKQISRSLQFLISHGLLRKNLQGKMVVNEDVAFTTDNEPNVKIKTFHRQALQIARKGMQLYPISRRRSETYILAVNEDQIEALKSLIGDCMDRVEQFDKEQTDSKEALYQITMHLTPIGGSREEKR